MSELQLTHVPCMQDLHIGEFVLSNELVSMTLAMVSENRDVNTLLRELFTPAGNELYVLPAARYLRCAAMVHPALTLEGRELLHQWPSLLHVQARYFADPHQHSACLQCIALACVCVAVEQPVHAVSWLCARCMDRVQACMFRLHALMRSVACRGGELLNFYEILIRGRARKEIVIGFKNYGMDQPEVNPKDKASRVLSIDLTDTFVVLSTGIEAGDGEPQSTRRKAKSDFIEGLAYMKMPSFSRG